MKKLYLAKKSELIAPLTKIPPSSNSSKYELTSQISHYNHSHNYPNYINFRM